MSPDIPERIGNYEILGVIGRGGMATVYKAIQPSLNRIVAIKVLPPKMLEDRVWVERFNREAQAVAMMNHPNIVNIIDKDRDGDLLYFVMEYVQGTSLQNLMAKRRLTLGEALYIAKEVAKGLQCAHRNGIIHRDLNPRNILVSDDLSVVKVADFGISRIESISRESGTLTTAQSGLGTLYYYAPEQAENPAKVDHRADIYSLGVVCYEMLTGKVPVGKFSLPSQLNQSLPASIDAVVLRCLNFDPKQRYATVGELLADIDKLEKDAGFKLLNELKGLSRSTSDLFRRGTTGLIKKRHIVGWTAAAVVVLALAIVAGIQVVNRVREAREAAAAVPAQVEQADVAAQPPAQPPQASQTGQAGPPAGQAAQVTLPATEGQPPGEAAVPPTGQGQAATGGQVVTGGQPPAGEEKQAVQPAKLPPSQVPAQAAAKTSPTPARAGAASDRSRTGKAAPDTSLPKELDEARAKIEAGQYEAAVAELQAFLAKNPGDPQAVEARFLVARAREKQENIAAAIAAYQDISERHSDNPRAAEALLRQAQLTLRTRGQEKQARALLVQLADRYPTSPSLLPALVSRAALEEKLELYERDPVFGSSSPSALLTYRTIAEKFATDPEAEQALWKIGTMCEELRRWPQAAQAYVDLGTRFPGTKLDAWFRAGDIYDRRLERPAEARAAFEKVPETSPRYQEAQRRAARLRK